MSSVHFWGRDWDTNEVYSHSDGAGGTINTFIIELDSSTKTVEGDGRMKSVDFVVVDKFADGAIFVYQLDKWEIDAERELLKG